MSNRKVIVHPNDDLLAKATANRLLLKLIDIQSVKRPIHLIITGGTIGIKVLVEVKNSALLEAVDWSGVNFWWTDERFLPAGDGERNEVQAQEALLGTLAGLPKENIHRVAASDAETDVEKAAELYTQELAKFAAEGDISPHFDIAIIGLGPDAHIASLFPDHEDLAKGKENVGAISIHNSPKPPALRVSLTLSALANTANVWFVAGGAGKAAAVSNSLSESATFETTPGGVLFGSEETMWLIDLSAADFS